MLTSSVPGTVALTDLLSGGNVSTAELVPVADEDYAPPAPFSTSPGRVASEVSRILGLATGQPGTQIPGEADRVVSRHHAMFGGRPDRIKGQSLEHRLFDGDDPTDPDQRLRGGADELAAEVHRISSGCNGNMFGMESPRPRAPDIGHAARLLFVG